MNFAQSTVRHSHSVENIISIFFFFFRLIVALKMGHCHENWYANVKLKEGDQSTKFGRSNTIHLQSKKEPTLKFLIQVA